MKEWITNVSESFKEFIINNGENPVLWICLFFGGILIFWLTYGALNKTK